MLAYWRAVLTGWRAGDGLQAVCSVAGVLVLVCWPAGVLVCWRAGMAGAGGAHVVSRAEAELEDEVAEI